MRGIRMLCAVGFCLALGVALGVAVPAIAEEGAEAPAVVEPAVEAPATTPAPVTLAGKGNGKGGGGAEECFCSVTVECGSSSGGTLSCSDSTGPCDCSGQDRRCLRGERGWVQCDGGPKEYCDPCCIYIMCVNGRSCTTHDDCCGATGPWGFCSGGECICSL